MNIKEIDAEIAEVSALLSGAVDEACFLGEFANCDRLSARKSELLLKKRIAEQSKPTKKTMVNVYSMSGKKLEQVSVGD